MLAGGPVPADPPVRPILDSGYSMLDPAAHPLGIGISNFEFRIADLPPTHPLRNRRSRRLTRMGPSNIDTRSCSPSRDAAADPCRSILPLTTVAGHCHGHCRWLLRLTPSPPPIPLRVRTRTLTRTRVSRRTAGGMLIHGTVRRGKSSDIRLSSLGCACAS